MHLVPGLRTLHQALDPEYFLWRFHLKSFIVLRFPFSMTQNVRLRAGFIVLSMNIQLHIPHHMLKRLPFLYCITFRLLTKIAWVYFHGFALIAVTAEDEEPTYLEFNWFLSCNLSLSVASLHPADGSK